jgi:uncharacterized membrane protein HdeD (DUF308 family)
LACALLRRDSAEKHCDPNEQQPVRVHAASAASMEDPFMIANEITSFYHQAKWAVLLRGLLSLIVGILIFARPLESVAALALVIAIWSLVDGFVNIVRAFALRGVMSHWGVLLVGGVISVLFGIAALYFYPALSLAFAVVWTSLWLITSGFVAVYIAMMERRVGVSWSWTMAFGILAIVGGAIAFVYPAITLVSLLGVLSAYGIIGGIVLLIGAGKMQSVESEVKHSVGGTAKA